MKPYLQSAFITATVCSWAVVQEQSTAVMVLPWTNSVILVNSFYLFRTQLVRSKLMEAQLMKVHKQTNQMGIWGIAKSEFWELLPGDGKWLRNQNQGSIEWRKYYRARHEKTWVLVPFLSFTSRKHPTCLHLWKGDKWSCRLSLSVFDWIEWGYAWKSSVKWNIKTPTPLIALIFITQIR